MGGAVLRRLGLRRRRPVGRSYVDATYARFQLEPGMAAPNATVQMWLDFALGSVDRGRVAVAAMGGRRAFRRKRVLDVGCAYAGFLIASAEAGATKLVGIDIDAGLLDLARLQLADYRKQATLELADITKPDVPDRLGRFDLALCNDVLEHVEEPAVCAANLAALLVPRGSVYLQIPKGQAVDFMLNDGHYGLFGITLLDRQRAERWWARTYSDPLRGGALRPSLLLLGHILPGGTVAASPQCAPSRPHGLGRCPRAAFR
jgi:SAM-dependent methyltransferase